MYVFVDLAILFLGVFNKIIIGNVAKDFWVQSRRTEHYYALWRKHKEVIGMTELRHNPKVEFNIATDNCFKNI